MNKLAALLSNALLSTIVLAALAGCGQQEPSTQARQAQQTTMAPTETAPVDVDGTTEEVVAPEVATDTTPTEVISEIEDTPETLAEQQAATVHPSVRMGTIASRSPTSAQFKAGTHYEKIVPAQPTSVGPDKVEVLEMFWYGCPHCFALDPAIESWRANGKPAYVEFVRVPAMWNETLRIHARVFYTAMELGKLEQLHSLIFSEINVNRNPLNTAESIGAFFQQHGVSEEAFKEAFSSFGVESKLQRADFLNRRYRVQSVPTIIVNGKYRTSLTAVGGEGQETKLFALINELAAHEHGG